MNTQIEVSVTDFRLISKLQYCTSIEKNQILMTLYERCKNLILKICFHYLKDYDQAQDVFHDAFIKVIENAEKLKNPEVFQSWFVTITRNLCIDRLRRMSFKNQESITEQDMTNERIEDLFFENIEKNRVMFHLLNCIHRLDGSLGKILKLRWQGLRAAEISKMIVLSRKDVRKSYRKIKTILESSMKNKGIKIKIDQIVPLAEIQGTF